jgi:VRR-NUC domain
MAATGVSPCLRLLFCIPNGARTGAKQGAKLVAEGMKRGVPDLCLPVAARGFHGLWIEMKHGKNTTTDDQDQWLADLDAQGYKTCVCYTADAAIAEIKHYLNLTGDLR